MHNTKITAHDTHTHICKNQIHQTNNHPTIPAIQMAKSR